MTGAQLHGKDPRFPRNFSQSCSESERVRSSVALRTHADIDTREPQKSLIEGENLKTIGS